jgi:ArsR family transcriptional regulator, lead/cadmium/zinc/bismuth-responsive transcriptional repressor
MQVSKPTKKKEHTCEICEIYEVHQTMMERAQLQLLDKDSSSLLAETFKILGDPTRIRILSLLFEDEMCVCDIAESLQMGQSAISHQLRVLRAARLVKFRKEGKSAWYSLDDDHVVGLMNQGLEHIKHS